MEVVGPDECNRAQPPDVHEPGPATPTPDEHKFRLPFILNVPSRHGSRTHQSALAETVAVVQPASVGRTDVTTDAKVVSELSKEEKKRRRTCKHEGCHNYIVHKGLCCRHGVRHCEICDVFRPSTMDAFAVLLSYH